MVGYTIAKSKGTMLDCEKEFLFTYATQEISEEIDQQILDNYTNTLVKIINFTLSYGFQPKVKDSLHSSDSGSQSSISIKPQSR